MTRGCGSRVETCAAAQPFLKRMYVTLDDFEVLISDPHGTRLVNVDGTFTLEQVTLKPKPSAVNPKH